MNRKGSRVHRWIRIFGRFAPYALAAVPLVYGLWTLAHHFYPASIFWPFETVMRSPALALLFCGAGSTALLALIERSRLLKTARRAEDGLRRIGRERDLALRQARRMRLRAEGLTLMREIHRSTGEPDRFERLHRILTPAADLFEAREVALFSVGEAATPRPTAYLVASHRGELFLTFNEEAWAAAVKEEKGGGLSLKSRNVKQNNVGQTINLDADVCLRTTAVARARMRLVLDAGQEAARRQKAEDVLEPILARLDFGPVACRMAGEALLQRRPLVRRESVLGGPLDANDDCRMTIFVPLLAEQKPVGVLRLRRAAEGLADGEAELLEELLIESAKHIALALKKEDDDRQAVTDGLTKLLVKRRFLQMLEERRMRAESDQGRRNDAFVLAMIDVDHFKKINDTHGHLSGDIVLRDVAGILRGGLRGGDYAFRYGGEEMTLLLNTPSLETGRKTAERLRKAIQTATFRGDKGQTVPVTASMGLALFEPGLSAEGLMARADKALYAAKNGGRNRVVVWEPALEKTTTAPTTPKTHVNSVRAPSVKRAPTSVAVRTPPAKSSRQK